MDSNLEKLSRIVPSERVLLLPHCLRRSNSCKAKYDHEGLQCAGCNPQCSINRLRSVALDCGYKGVCVAPGGHLAIKYIEQKWPRAIVAVACRKELEEGVQGVQKMAAKENAPLIIIVPLIKDGCIDTVVDDLEARTIISAGCIPIAIG